MKLLKIFAFTLLVPSAFSHVSAIAEDELYLCGIIKDINQKNETIIIDVQSKSCHGLRKFKLHTLKEMQSVNTDERKCFFIDSNRCNVGFIYNIIKIERN